MTQPRQAIVILGHSNAGKSPLGALIEDTLSTLQKRFLHLDFGEQLRGIAAGSTGPVLTPDQVAMVLSVMNGTLLTDADFPIARAIVDHFWSANRMVPGSDYLILNGIPRHMGQAQGLSDMGISVETVVLLDCPAAVALERRRLSDQGKGFEDRSNRDDAAYEIFSRKLKSFVDDTLPLVAWYEQRSTPVLKVPILVDTSPEMVMNSIKTDVWALAME